jgi:polysaccharide biosynthesis transport protein
MELKHYLSILRRWGWIMVLCTVLASVASFLFSSQQPRVYEGVSQYLVGPVLDNPNVRESDLRAAGSVGQTYVALATTRPILQSVVDKLKLNTNAQALAPNVTATWLDATQVLTIRARAANPEMAANISNAIGETLIDRSPSGSRSLQAQRQQESLTEIARLQENIRTIEDEIDQLSQQVQQTTDQVTQRALIVRLDERRAQLAANQRALSDQYTIVQSASTNQINVFQEATPNPTPIAPEIVRNVLAALIAGLVLGLAAMLLFEYFTDVIYTPEELRKTTGLPFLGGIARHKRLRGSGTSQLVVQARPETLAAESFRMLRTNLQLAGTDLHLPSLLVTSPSRGDGKSEIAANLAVSLARAGKQVILVDANLRRPRIAALFGLPEDGGLSNMLDAPGQGIPLHTIDTIPGLAVVPAGSITANSSEVLGSQQMYRLIQEWKGQADVVIFDSPPLLYSDALVLAPQVDGVLLAVNSGTTGRENTINAVESLRLVGAHLIGTVLNRVKAGPAYSYYPASASKRPLPALAATSATPALQGPSVVQSERARVERVLTGDNSEPGGGEPTDEPSGAANPARMTRQLEAVTASAHDEISAEVGGPTVSYEGTEAKSGPVATSANGHRDDHTRHGRRNRSGG